MKNHYDVLIVGAGIAGLSAAIAAAEKGLSVLILGKGERFEESNTWHAQGGIVESGAGDSPELLRKDILRAGSGINNYDALEVVTSEGPNLVDEILVNRAKVPFHKTQTGEFDRTQEGAHSVRRILHVKDYTGRSIAENLLAYVSGLKTITMIADMTAVDIITNTHHSKDSQQRYKPRKALGVYVLNNKSGEVHPMFAPSVVLATGGAGNLYLHTSNPASATGDGIAMAHRAGCDIINAEYVQFHPTVLFHRDIKRFLISESLRGEGARLMNRNGDYFMEAYNPELKDLAPRDEVARAIYREMGNQGGYVLLDATGIKHVDPAQRFPSIYKQCKSLGIDISKDPIPVVPAAHYFCGGVKTNMQGATEIEGLYVVGESACNGIHGANRLASVSLLESLVFGYRAGAQIAETAAQLDGDLLASIPEWVSPKQETEFDPMLIQSDLETIQTTLWNYVGIIRTRRRLSRAISDLNYLEHRIQSFYRQARISREIIELRNAIVTGGLITHAAYKNKQSLGCHFVVDGRDNGDIE